MKASIRLPQDLEKRRCELGLNRRQLARRSGVHPATVRRILSGQRAAPLVSSVVAIAECLGLELVFVPKADPQTMVRAQADQKARKLVFLVTGTAGPEAEAVARPMVEAMVKQTARELLAGPRRRLWSD